MSRFRDLLVELRPLMLPRHRLVRFDVDLVTFLDSSGMQPEPKSWAALHGGVMGQGQSGEHALRDLIAKLRSA